MNNKQNTVEAQDKTNAVTKANLNKQYKELFNNITKAKQVWKDLKSFINPQIGCFEEDNPNSCDRDDEELINQTPTKANIVLAAGMQTGITSPSRPWFKLNLINNDFDGIDEVTDWVADCETKTYGVLAQSNFYNSAHSFYEELGCFGSSCMLILEDLNKVVRYETLATGTYAIGLGEYGRAVRLARIVPLTVAQIVEEFGIENVPDQVKTQYENKNYNTFFKVKHLIYPNPDYDPHKLSNQHMKFKDVYWMDEGSENKFLKESGFSSNPICFARWKVSGSDIYGKGPGWLALPESKQLQLIVQHRLTALEMQINPVMNAPATALQNGGVNLNPGGVNIYSPNGSTNNNVITPAFQVNFNFVEANNTIMEIEKSINETFFANLFQMLIQVDHTGMTATEIRSREQEKMSMLGPVLERLQGEFLEPLIERTFELMQRVPGLLPETPEVIADQAMKIEYVSILAQAQRMTGITAQQQFTQFAIQLAQAKPEVLDNVNFDAAIEEYATALGVPPTMILGADKVQELRQARAQQMAEQQAQEQQMAAAQQMAQIANQGSQAASNLAGIPIDGQNNALNALMGMPGGLE